jgi:hypothetical protein
MDKVENLKKITLAFQASSCPETMDLKPGPSEFDFIFGLSPEGMTPFEYELVDRFVGEEISLHLKKETCYDFFEHLNPPFSHFFDGNNDLYVKVKIIGVATPQTREIIKAMAERAQQSEGGCAGGHGDCDCGCG